MTGHLNEYHLPGDRTATGPFLADTRIIFRHSETRRSSVIVGGPVPLAPDMLMHDSGRALGVSAAVTLLTLAVFGFVKGHFTGLPKLKGA